MRPEAEPAIGIGAVGHARSRPVEHRFTYPAFFLRLPMRRLSAGTWPWRWLARNAPAPLSIRDADHGDGGPMTAWIDRMLASAGIEDAGGELWLHTMPRVFGFLFNPVSFWFAERADGSLRAIVCEVNNTFGERHCYLLAHADGRPIRWGESLRARKALHVSPFNEVRGGYQFRFALREASGGEPPRFVSQIDYFDDEAQPPLLRTSISGALRPATDRSLASVALRFPLHTLGVVARIHWQALRLWLRRVPLRAKPEAPRTQFTPGKGPEDIALEEGRQ